MKRGYLFDKIKIIRVQRGSKTTCFYLLYFVESDSKTRGVH